MSGEEKISEGRNNDSLHKYFTKTVNFIDENLRTVQNLVYGAIFVGGLITLRSLRIFTKFKKIEDIPLDFVSKSIKLYGKVRSVHLVNINKPPPKEEKIEKLIKPNISFHSNFGKVLQSSTSFNLAEKRHSLYILVNHLPILSFRQSNEEAAILLKLSSIQISEEGLRRAEKDLLHRKVWFRILKECEAKTALDSIVQSPRAYFRTYNGDLVRQNLAFVEPFDQSMQENETYIKFYAKLLKEEANSDGTRKRHFWIRFRQFLSR